MSASLPARSSAGVRDPEAGFIGVGTVIAVAIVGLIAYVLLAAFESDTSSYGRVPVPSSGVTIELPGTETDVYYFEPVPFDEDAEVSPPGDFDYQVTDAENVAVRVNGRSGDPKEVEGGTARLIGAVFPEEEGLYRVRVTSDEAAGSRAELTFGQSPFQAIADRFDAVVDELKGTTGIIVLVVLVVLAFVPMMSRAWRRSH